MIMSTAAMMRNLLADRFKLMAHRESREMSVCGLVPAKGDKTLGPQLRRVDVDCAAEAARAMAARRGGAPPPSAKPDAMPPYGMRMRPGNVMARGTTLQQLTRNLSQFVGRRWSTVPVSTA